MRPPVALFATNIMSVCLWGGTVLLVFCQNSENVGESLVDLQIG